MNLGDSVQSLDDINKVEKIKEEGKEYNLLPLDRVTDISVRRKDQQITEKKPGSMSVPRTRHKQKNTWSEEDVYTSAWDLKRQYKISNFGLKAEIRWSLSSTCVFSGRRTTSQKVSPLQKKDMCELSLTASYNTQSSPSKNKKVNYIFIYLQVWRRFSSGSIYYNITHTYMNAL